MSGVVLRCPNCGTTQAGPGECEACHEAEVAYILHEPQAGPLAGSAGLPGMRRPVRRSLSCWQDDTASCNLANPGATQARIGP